MAELLVNLHARSPSAHLALSGGCALNSTFNGKLLDVTPFESLHVPSAPADDGNALGAAYVACMQDGVTFAPSERRAVPYLGSSIDRDALDRLERYGGFARLTRTPIGETIQRAAALLAAGKIIAWVQGQAEFGPRALGNRSILADPRPANIQDRINQCVKFREEFRPFAPSILDEAGADYFRSLSNVALHGTDVALPAGNARVAFRESYTPTGQVVSNPCGGNGIRDSMS